MSADNIEVTISVLDDDALIERVATEPENSNLFKHRIEYVTRPTNSLADIMHGKSERLHIALSVGRRIVGVSGVQLDPRNRKVMWVTHVGVEDAHREKGFARKLIEATFAHAVANELMVDPSSYTPMGEERIARIFEEYFGHHPQCRVTKHA